MAALPGLAGGLMGCAPVLFPQTGIPVPLTRGPYQNNGAYILAPFGIGMFNKVGGPKVISPKIATPALPAA